MWYWLEGLINSRLIDRDLLSAIYVVGFLLGVLIGSIVLRRVRGRYGWILMVFMGAVCTKVLIIVFEWLQFYNWDLMTSSPQFLEFCIIFFAIIATLAALLIMKKKRKSYPKHR
jgi:biotin transporter BioY